MSKTVVLAGVQTRNGMKVANIIAMLNLARIWWGECVWVLGDNDIAMPIRIDTEVMNLSGNGIDQGLRDRIYLMPLTCAEERIKEQPKNLTLVLGKTYTVYERKTADAQS